MIGRAMSQLNPLPTVTDE